MGNVRLNPARGNLFLDFRCGTRRYREYTALADTASNRRRLERLLARIEEAIAAGDFRYEDFFSKAKDSGTVNTKSRLNASGGSQVKGGRAEEGLPTGTPTGETDSDAPSFAEYAKSWLAIRRVEWRRSHLRTQQSTIEGRLVKHFGQRRIDQITRAEVLSFRANLATERGRKEGQTLSAKRINLIMTPLC